MWDLIVVFKVNIFETFSQALSGITQDSATVAL